MGTKSETPLVDLLVSAPQRKTDTGALENEDSAHDPNICLSNRAWNALLKLNIPRNIPAIRRGIENGRLDKVRGAGLVTINELRRLAGFPELDPPKTTPWKFNPWTGEPIPSKEKKKKSHQP